MTGIIAHRGFNGLYPENTRRAFEEALKLDIVGIECDVNLTKDGQVVVHGMTQADIDEVIAAFADRYDVTVELVETAQERVEFKVPRVLREPLAG